MNTTQPLEPNEALFNRLTELDGLSRQILALVETGFETLNRRVAQLEQRQTASEQFLQAMAQDVETVKDRVELMDEKLDAYLKEHGYLKKKLKEFDAKLNPPPVN
jgi:uncharacterized coiled-coil protein SlyX